MGGVPAAGIFLSWLALTWRLYRLCHGGGPSRYGGVTAAHPAISPSLIAKLNQEALRLRADTTLVPRERWRLMRAEIETLASSSSIQKGNAFQEIDMALEQAMRRHIIDERDVILCAKLRQLSGPFIIGVVGAAHLTGMERCWAEAEANKSDTVNESEALCAELYTTRRRKLWERLAGTPILWQLRGCRI